MKAITMGPADGQLLAIPERMAHLERDSRGYPVPFILLRDMDGKPYFAANDMRLVAQANMGRLCHICGAALGPEAWFVGGPGSFLLNGPWAVYRDGPLHHECLHYALQACPYLAHRTAVAVGPALRTHLEKNGGVTVFDSTDIPGVPPLFVAVRVAVWEITPGPTYSMARPFRKVEYWRSGAMLPLREGEGAAKRGAKELAMRLEPGRSRAVSRSSPA